MRNHGRSPDFLGDSNLRGIRKQVLVLAILAICSPIHSQQKAQKESHDARKEQAAHFPAAVWRNPGDVSKLDLLYGAGRKTHAPNLKLTYRFMREVTSGATPKFDVEDSDGVRWRVKLGSEAQTETAATRLLWASGYFVDEDYYLAELRVQGLPKLHRGQEYVYGGLVHGVRLERKLTTTTELGTWSWSHNPLTGTREMNGLRIMMALINNWDIKQLNNSIYAVDAERRYVVTDVGSSFGKTGASPFGRTENNVEQFAGSMLIRKTTPEKVDFVMDTRPFPLLIVLFPIYIEGVRRQNVVKNIPLADARWLAERLGRLSDSQISDCFRTAGYTPEKVSGFSQVIRRRIAAMKQL